ncbi:MAG: M1 family metallopeptidase [Crocinitomicaceae bacterium]|nr:M1 family metallopeptidase [Crocinitomicaceae bacterium]
MRTQFIILSLLLSSHVVAQEKEYFQQEVNYKIDVTLNDEDHTLSAYEEFEYINNSTTALDKIYIHIWPNAYKNTETALANQLYNQGNTVMQFAEEEDLGWIDSLDFKVDGLDAKWEYHPDHIDIAILHLNSVLKPGESIKVSTPFKVKLPSGSISRLGHVGESYQITQWYPKPAVFDMNGWNEMPYLTQGEFYSEYGSFDVSITLPKNYVVGATGDLQTESEKQFLAERVEQTKKNFENDSFSKDEDFPASDSAYKTIRYTQSNVHDFAWFADKRFEVLKGEVELPHSGRKVTSWAMFVPYHHSTWENALEYIEDGTYYYSKWNGDYPYNNVTAVDGTISAGGGMEYPNVTVIGSTSSPVQLEVVIVHEVGHNWFYGQLGSNEREHPWMDEGLNTLNEMRYIMTKYPKNQQLSDMMAGMAETVHLEHLSHHDMSDLTYMLTAGYGIDQPIELPADEYAQINYGAIVYSKTGLVFTYLRDYLGDEEFDKAMQYYYSQWEFKHPQPEDIRRCIEKSTGKDLSWFFEDIIKTTKKIDYKIKSVKKDEKGFTVEVANVGQIECPVRVDAFRFGKLSESKWVEPGGSNKVHFDGTTLDEFVIDNAKNMPDINRNNNRWKDKGLFKRVEKPEIEFLLGDNEPEKWNMWYTPIAGYNEYDKIMFGFMFHNQTLPKNKFEYILAPMFSVGRLNVAGFADFNYSWGPPRGFKNITLGVMNKTFGNGLENTPVDTAKGPRGTYYAVQPYLKFDIGKPKSKKYYKQYLVLQGAYIKELGGLYRNDTYGGFAEYTFNWKKRIQQFGTNVRMDYYNYDALSGLTATKGNLLNASLTLNYSIQYWPQKKKSVVLRAYFGKNLFYNGTRSDRYGMSLTGQSGTQDVLYQHFLMGRNEYNGLWDNQRIENQGGFKSVSDSLTSTDMIFGTNLIIQLPYLPLVLYGDIGLLDQNGSIQTAYDAGIGIRFGEIFGIYFPFVESSNMYDPAMKYWNRIRFTLNLNGYRPSNIIRMAL